jgi:hypothetical protein
MKSLMLFAFVMSLASSAFAGSIPPQPGASVVPEFIGRPAVPHPLRNARPIPQNPFTASDPWSNGHNDSYMSDTYPLGVPGPLGRDPQVLSTFLSIPTSQAPFALSAIMTFDRNGLLVGAFATGDTEQNRVVVRLTLIQPSDLATLATYELPAEAAIVGGGFRPAGAYFFRDEGDLTVIGTVNRTLQVVSHSMSAGVWSFELADEWDLTQAIPEGDAIQAVQPDWSGRLWFTSKGGVVGVLDRDGNLLGYTHALRDAGERIVNGHAVDEDGGVYIASTAAMYRFDADADAQPVVTWRETYDAGTYIHPGQTDIGTGTTPTLMGREYVAITDNGEPRMRVLVYKRGKNVRGSRLICAEPVFGAHMASNENSLIATDRSIIVENNHGYTNPLVSTTGGRTTTPGIARVDLTGKGGCRTAWTNESVSIPSLISKMSLANGLIYTYTKPEGPDANTDPWYFTAIDFHTGKVVYQQLAGTGVFFNNHYAGAYLGPDGTLYVGVLGGVVAMRDGPSHHRRRGSSPWSP